MDPVNKKLMETRLRRVLEAAGGVVEPPVEIHVLNGVILRLEEVGVFAREVPGEEVEHRPRGL